MKSTIFSIGHSNRAYSEFVKKLKENKVDTLIDIRTFPRSRFCPWFNEKRLSEALKESHSEDLAQYEAQKEGLNNQSKRLQQRMEEMYDDKLDRRITAEFYDEKFSTFKNEVEDIKQALNELEDGNVYHYESGFAIHELATRSYEIYKSKKATVDDRRLLLSYSFSNIGILQGNIRVEYTKAFQFLADWIPPVNEALEHDKTLVKYGRKSQLSTLQPVMLAWRDGFRTVNWREAVGDIETTMKEITHLLALI
jgi:hypothetical protein